MRNPLTQELYGYWLAMRSPAFIPDPKAANCAPIRTVWPYVFILEGTTPDSIVIEFCGAALNRISSQELAGINFLDLWDSWDENDIKTALTTVAALRLPLLVGASALTSNQRSIYFEILLLPLHKNMNMLGSLLQADDARWIEAPLGRLKFVSMRILKSEPAANKKRFGIRPAPAPRPPLIVYNGCRSI